MDETAVNALLFPPAAPPETARLAPEWPTVHQELRRKGVTLELVWQPA